MVCGSRREPNASGKRVPNAAELVARSRTRRAVKSVNATIRTAERIYDRVNRQRTLARGVRVARTIIRLRNANAALSHDFGAVDLILARIEYSRAHTNSLEALRSRWGR